MVTFTLFTVFTVTPAQIQDFRKWKYFYYQSKSQF
ncbi:unnamed protein product [Paramecium pentaurelia]|uniref:Uncharacterized protein n=1 Tax=Paramecium pentaurelia TaxID=43138 RepID=A0A8S1YDV5_9CILI|nr:unnamed protein product [Paramecium pentaurelia]